MKTDKKQRKSPYSKPILRIVIRGIGNSWTDNARRVLAELGYSNPDLRDNGERAPYNLDMFAGHGDKGCEKDPDKLFKKLMPVLQAADGGMVDIHISRGC